ncbi:MAG: Holliday junction resolvase RuvX [Bifidobacteriaceae bacterium]|nr:Holliday junction resolvase RuvX [Bifidobacteriaceae bacterium]
MTAQAEAAPPSPAGPWLGVDLGLVRVGLAVSDPDRLLAMPLATLPRADLSVEALAGALAAVAAERQAVRVVVGVPWNMDGSAGPRALEALAVAEALRAAGTPCAAQDERLTTVEAETLLRAAGRTAKRQRPVVDQAAAVIILQAALDAARR